MIPTHAYQQSLALMLPAACFLATPAHALSTWVGTTDTTWSVATNWVPGVPPAGDAVTIADATTNSTINLDTSASIGLMTFGTSGTRTTAFTLNTQAANQLTLGGGITANGNLASTALTLRGRYVVSTAQNWSVGGNAAHSGDQGVFVREITTGATNRGSLALDANLTKIGTGQLVVAAIDITGAGNLIVDAGVVKLNAGASQPLVIGGTGNITMNNASTLAVYRNSGTMSITRPIVMNGTSSLVARNSTVDIDSAIAFNGTHTLDANGSTNLTGAWSGSGTVNRIGTGIITLSGASAGFTGTLNANAGTTLIQGTFGGAANLALTGTLGGEGSVAGLLTLNGGILSVDASTAGALTAGNGVTLTGVSPVNFSKVPLPGASFTVLNYAGALTGSTANLSIPGTRSPAFTDTGSAITATIGNATRTWTGGGAVVAWDIGVTDNWLEGDLKFFQGDAVTFGNTGAGTIPITGVLNPSSITIQNDAGSDYTFTAAANNFITGGTAITKSGDGVVTLQGANTYTGGITVNGGVFKVGGNQAPGANGNTITIASGGTWDTNGQQSTSRDYHAIIAGTGSGTGAIVNTGAGHQTGFRSLTLTADASIGGTGRWDVRPITAGTASLDLGGHTLKKIGSNVIALVDGNLSSAGTVDINEGTLAVTRFTMSGTGDFNVNNGAMLQLENYNSGNFNRPIKLDGSTLRSQGANFTLDSTVTVTGASKLSSGAGFTFTIPTAVGGSGAVEKLDTGTLVLAGDNSYSGTTTVTAGILTITGDNTASSDTVINSGTLQIGNGGTTGAIKNSTVSLNSTSAAIRFNRSDDIAFTAVISGSGITGNALNPAAVNKDGNNTLTLSAANTYTGTTRLGAGMIAIASDASVFGDPSALIDLRNGGIRSADASPRTIPNPISYSNSTVWGSPGTGDLTLSGAIAYGGGSKTITVECDRLIISGAIAGSGAGATNLTKAGPGTLVLTADNTYTQTTVISQGTFQVGDGGTSGSVAGSASIVNNAALVIHRSLPEETENWTFGSLISGTGSLTHSGPAHTILSAANTYTGDTIITDGTVSTDLPYLADSAAVRVSGNGKIELFHGLTDAVDTFHINGSPQPAGLWGRIGAQAFHGNPTINETPFILGDGLLNVASSGGTPYTLWAATAGLTGANDEPADNPDSDGLDNLGEFALDGDPLSGASGGKVVVKVASVGGQPALTLTLPVRTAVGAFTGADALTATGDGATYTIEGSDDLGSWLLDIDEVTGPDAASIQASLPALSSGDWTYRTFRSPGPVAGDAIEFLRARIE
jgi:autotransporter-associated beta strand protein